MFWKIFNFSKDTPFRHCISPTYIIWSISCGPYHMILRNIHMNCSWLRSNSKSEFISKVWNKIRVKTELPSCELNFYNQLRICNFKFLINVRINMQQLSLICNSYIQLEWLYRCWWQMNVGDFLMMTIQMLVNKFRYWWHFLYVVARWLC